MLIMDLIFALIIALLLAIIFGMGFRRQRLGAGLFWFFVILLLATWAGGIWITPFGPMMYGVPWISFLMVGIIFAFLIVAVVPPPAQRPPITNEIRNEKEEETEALIVLNTFVWILLIGFIAAIIARYVA